jgi:uncharacterized membrane protein
MPVSPLPALDTLAAIKDQVVARALSIFSDRKLWQRRAGLAGIAVVAAAIVHIGATLIAPYLSTGDAFQRIARNLPINRFVLLPIARPNGQVLPYQSPVSRLSICRFDTNEGPVSLKAILPEAGWSFSIYSENGDGLYTLTGQPDRRTEANILMYPVGERFIGRSTEPRFGGVDFVQVAAPTGRGLAVLRAPVKGKGYGFELDQDLARASCRQEKF